MNGTVIEELDSTVIDKDIFAQVTELDEYDDDAVNSGEEEVFSKSLVSTFHDQAEQTFQEIQDGISKKDYEGIARNAHKLKGSSATLGVKKLRITCEIMQHTGEQCQSMVEDGKIVDLELEEKINSLLDNARVQLKEAMKFFNEYYAQMMRDAS